jgi:hypothetical protein
MGQRQAIRELCKSITGSTQRPEQLLIGFKEALSEAANDARIRPGPERTETLSRIVTVFIEELYGLRVGYGRSEDRASAQQL